VTEIMEEDKGELEETEEEEAIVRGMQSVLVRLMHGERRRIEINLPMTVYKGRDGRQIGVIAIPKGEVEGSRPMVLEGSARVQALEVEGPCPMALGAVCVCTSLRSRRSDGFGIIIFKTRGACVITII
jgi:hypothetical protein